MLEPPPGARVLAGNRVLGVQALEIRHGAGWFWGTQYHPELDLDELAAMLRLCDTAIVEAGLAEDARGRWRPMPTRSPALAGGAIRRPPRRLAWRHGIGPEVLRPDLRRREIGNFLAQLSTGEA